MTMSMYFVREQITTRLGGPVEDALR